MTPTRLDELRQIALQHKGKNRSADYMMELIQYCDELRRLYGLALEFGWSDHRSKAIAFSQLKKLAEK